MTIDVYTWPTPNGHKVHIMLHEAEIAHNIIPINIQEGDQFMEEGISHHHHVLCQGVDECQEASARGPK